MLRLIIKSILFILILLPILGWYNIDIRGNKSEYVHCIKHPFPYKEPTRGDVELAKSLFVENDCLSVLKAENHIIQKGPDAYQILFVIYIFTKPLIVDGWYENEIGAFYRTWPDIGETFPYDSHKAQAILNNLISSLGSQLLPVTSQAIFDGDIMDRALCFYIYKVLDGNNIRSIPVLIDSLAIHDPFGSNDVPTIHTASSILASYDAEVVLPYLIEAIQYSNDTIKIGAMNSISLLGKKAYNSLPVLIGSISHNNNWVRIAAIKAIASVSKGTTIPMKYAEILLKDADIYVREAAENILEGNMTE